MRTLVAVDLSPASDDAVRVAMKQRTEGDTLGICHVVPRLTAIHPLFPHLITTDLEVLGELPRRAAEAIASHLESELGLEPSEYDLFIDEGVDYAEIVSRAEKYGADRLLIGSSGAGGLRRVLGSVATRVVRYAPCVVQCVRGGDSDGPVIAATDLSDSSAPALREGAAEARRRGVSLIVTYVAELGGMSAAVQALSPFGTNFIPSNAADNERTLARETIASELAAMKAEGEIVVHDGPAASSIVRLAEERGASLIVVGTHGRTGFARLALGSVAERVIRDAPCDVLAIRMPSAKA